MLQELKGKYDILLNDTKTEVEIFSGKKVRFFSENFTETFSEKNSWGGGTEIFYLTIKL